jgi:hypothetical protein
VIFFVRDLLVSFSTVKELDLSMDERMIPSFSSDKEPVE